MQKELRKLSLAIKDQNTKEAVALYCKLVRNNVDQRIIVSSIIKDAIPILYRNKYFQVPHGIMGIIAANDISECLEVEKALPLLQAICYLSEENKLAPLDFSMFVPLYIETDEPLKVLENYILEGDILKTYRLFKGLLEKETIDNLYSEIFKFAMKDLVNIGHKVIYYHKTLELITYLNETPQNVFYPSISYLASEPKDYTLSNNAIKEYQKLLDSKLDISKNDRGLSKDDSSALIDVIISSMRSRVLSSITILLQKGISINAIADNITLAASQLILDTDLDEWVLPVHGFNYCYAVNWWIRNFNDKDKALALYLQAAFINHLSIELKKVHFTGSYVFVKHQNILNNIITSIRSSNISDSVCLTQSYVLSNGDVEKLLKLLALSSVQNDSTKNFAHDIKFTSSCIKEYRDNSSPNKWLILVSLAKHLSQSKKDYTNYTLYNNCLNAKVNEDKQ